jgi:hypothetical protein
VGQGRGQAVDRRFLLVEVAIAEIVAVVGLGQGPVIDRVEEEGNSVDRRIVVALMDVGEGQAGRAADPESDGRSEAPAAIFLDVPAGHVVAMEHCVEPDRDSVPDPPVDVGRSAVIIVGADRAGDYRQVSLAGDLGDDVDRAPDAARTVEDGIGAVVDLDLLGVERVGAAVLGAVAHSVLGDVVVRRIAAQIDRIAIAAPAFAGAEGDSGNGGESVAKGEQILPPQGLVGYDGDGLRRIDEIAGRLGGFELGLVACAGDDDVALAALYGALLLRRERG